MKCEICKKDVVTIYLEKVAGTYVKDPVGKRHLVCDTCQRDQENDKQRMLGALN